MVGTKLSRGGMRPDRRRSEQRSESRIEFVGEQDGRMERRLKRLLASELQNFHRVTRAYLARIGFAPDLPIAVALCLAPSESEDPAVVDAIARIAADNLAVHVAMDIVFVSAEQEEELRLVCRAFYHRQ